MVSVKYSLAKMYGRMLGYEATTLTGIKYDILDCFYGAEMIDRFKLKVFNLKFQISGMEDTKILL